MSGRGVAACIIVWMLSASLLSATGDNVAGTASVADMEYEPRGRIVILGNEGFTPENGVRSGNGTHLNPYIIEGWEIDLSEDDGDGTVLDTSDGIVVQNTDAYFVIRDTWIHSGKNAPENVGSGGTAILMYNSRLSLIQDCVLSDNHAGIRLLACSWVTVSGCTIVDSYLEGISAESCDFVRVEDCVVERNPLGGVDFMWSEYCDLVDSTVTGAEHFHAVGLYGAEHCSVRNCNVTDSTVVGINIGFSNHCNVSGNSIERNRVGLCTYGSEDITMESNVYLDNELDIDDGVHRVVSWTLPMVVSIIMVAAIVIFAVYIEVVSRAKGEGK